MTQMQAAELWAGYQSPARKGTILEATIINHLGYKLYHPELAPVRVMIMAHWLDGVVAVSSQRPDGTWFRAKFSDDDDGTPMWEPTNATMIGWLGLAKSL